MWIKTWAPMILFPYAPGQPPQGMVEGSEYPSTMYLYFRRLNL